MAAAPLSSRVAEPAPKQDAGRSGGAERPAQTGEGGQPAAPSFDVVRVEPTGESVIAGRSAAGATIEMLRDGKSHARAMADTSGLFALVPPPLAPGSHEIVLQSIAPDGTRRQSRESVTVVIDQGRKAQPLVTLTSPDRPTVVLSSPQPSAARVAAAPIEPAVRRPAASPTPPAAAAPPPTAAATPPAALPSPLAAAPASPAAAPAPTAGPRPEVKIGTVEAEQGGRLFVSGNAAPGATVRLYLNETFIAPGGAGADGVVSFAIGRGVRPGDYRVRLDDVDPVSGEVKSRAEVPFNVPAPLVAAAPQGQPLVTSSAGRQGTSGAAPFASSGLGRQETSAAPLASSGPGRQETSGAAPLASSDPVRAPATVAAPQPPRAANPGPVPERETLGRLSATPPLTGPSLARVLPAPGAQPADRSDDTGPVLVPEVNTALVARGDNLWRISRRIYGQGTRYTVIYDANQAQIRNPNFIYPGQIFVLPPGEAPATAR